jgi:cystathionine beta-lyase/cystathionine gamma-synthase
MSAQDAHLVMRGLKTLTLRMDRHCQSAQTVAEAIEQHPASDVVYFPGPKTLLMCWLTFCKRSTRCSPVLRRKPPRQWRSGALCWPK